VCVGGWWARLPPLGRAHLDAGCSGAPLQLHGRLVRVDCTRTGGDPEAHATRRTPPSPRVDSLPPTMKIMSRRLLATHSSARVRSKPPRVMPRMEPPSWWICRRRGCGAGGCSRGGGEGRRGGGAPWTRSPWESGTSGRRSRGSRCGTPKTEPVGTPYTYVRQFVISRMTMFTPGHMLPDVTMAQRTVDGSHTISAKGPAVRNARGRGMLSALAVRKGCTLEHRSTSTRTCCYWNRARTCVVSVISPSAT